MGQIALMRLVNMIIIIFNIKIVVWKSSYFVTLQLSIANEKCLFPWGKGWSLWGLITTNGDNKIKLLTPKGPRAPLRTSRFHTKEFKITCEYFKLKMSKGIISQLKPN